VEVGQALWVHAKSQAKRSALAIVSPPFLSEGIVLPVSVGASDRINMIMEVIRVDVFSCGQAGEYQVSHAGVRGSWITMSSGAVYRRSNSLLSMNEVRNEALYPDHREIG
jgi:hypothetical protein